MGRKALTCQVEIDIHALSSPGTWLTKQDGLYVSVRMFGQVQRTRLVAPLFPLIFHDKLRFNKVFYSAYEPSQVTDALEDAMVRVDLIQESEYYSGGRLLAWYDSSACQFLYPHPSYLPPYGFHDRELLLERSVLFPGISPKLEFSSKTVIKEVATSLLDRSFLDEGSSVNQSTQRQSRKRSSWRERSYGSSSPASTGLRRSRSMSPGPRLSSRSISPRLRGQLKELNLDGDSERPPFVVRKVDKSLIHRTPSSGTPIFGTKSLIERDSNNGESDEELVKGYSKSGSQALKRASSSESDMDLNSDDQYGLRRSYDDLSTILLHDRIRQTLERRRRRQHLDDLLSYQRYWPYPYYRRDSIDDLELDLELARRRRYYL